MDYPLTLLPQLNYKIIDCDLSDYCLIRHSHLPQENLLDSLGKLKEVVIASGAEKVLPDYSTSLFGVFNLENVKIRVTNSDYQEYCEPNIEVIPPVFGTDFENVEDRGYWSIMISSINNQEINYEDDSLKAICKVVHTPMKWNFWHFSIHWFILDINDYWHKNLNYQTTKIRRKLATEARGLLKQFGRPIILSSKVINPECYSN